MIKKISAIFLALMLCIACVPMTVGAQTDMVTTGTKITSLSDISDLAGEYYLEAPITVSQTLAGTFTGTLHGNGQTITTSTTLFNALGEGAVIENLNIEGAVVCNETFSTADNVYRGVLANKIIADANADIIKTTEIKNITNNASLTLNVTSTASASIKMYMGLVAYAEADVNFSNVVNNGAITYDDVSTSKANHINGMGGILGTTDNTAVSNLTFLNCKNTGNITIAPDTSKAAIINTCLVGGIAGHTNSQNVTVEYINCENSGTIEAKNVKANGGIKLGGITGYAAQTNSTYKLTNCINRGDIKNVYLGGGIVSDMRGKVTYTDCINFGDISNTSSANQQVYLGGISGQNYGMSSVKFLRCSNFGDILCKNITHVNNYVAGISGNSVNKTSMTDCVNYGTISSSKQAAGIIGKYTNQAGTFTRCMNFGSVTGGTLTASIIANIETGNTTTNKIVLTDCYSVQEDAVGTTQAPSAQKGNVSYVYNGQTVADINKDTAGDKTAYNTFFNENGKKTVAELSGDAVVANTALSFGDTWTVLEGHPMLNSAFAVTYEKTADTSDMEFIGFQVSNEKTAEGKYSVRFVSQISEALAENIDKVGFTVTYIQSGSRSVKEITVSDTKVYTSINANVDGKLEAMTADEGCYFVALTVSGVDSAAIDSFIVTPFTVTGDTTTNCEAYVCKVEKGVGNEQIKPYSYDFKYTKTEENN